MNGVLKLDSIEQLPSDLSLFKSIYFKFDNSNSDTQTEFLERLAQQGQHLEKVVSVDAPSTATLRKLLSTKNVFQVLGSKVESNELDAILKSAAERYDERQRRSAFEESEKDDKNMQRAQKRITTLNKQIESLHNALVAVHRANSVGEVESLLYEALKDSLQLEWLRIFFHSHSPTDEHFNRLAYLKLVKVPLQIGNRDFGKIVFARQKTKTAQKFEDELLHQVADGVALAIDRLTKLEQSESLKQQWESTFDAISEPLCLTDENFKIIRTNSAFSKVTGLSYTKLIGSNCFESFGARESVTSDKSFRIQRGQGDNLRTYEVSTQRIRIKASEASIRMILFRDITEQQRIEKQIFESSKMAELGTIGSSIAHELNNPLGGMLSFLQLIKMDLQKDDPITDDINAMEQAGLRCKEIIENLLGFSRRPDPSEATQVDLREVIRQALKITELQARSLGVTVEMRWPENPVCVLGHFNLLAQALSHILQNAFEAVSDQLTESPGFKGHIKIELRQKNDRISISISDNGVGISPELQNKILNPLFSTKTRGRNTGLGLTLAYKIIDEHKGDLEIFSQPKMGTTVKIAFASV